MAHDKDCNKVHIAEKYGLLAAASDPCYSKVHLASLCNHVCASKTILANSNLILFSLGCVFFVTCTSCLCQFFSSLDLFKNRSYLSC